MLDKTLLGACSAAALALSLTISGCGPAAVALRPSKTCDGGNLEDCKTRCDQNEGRACYRLGWFYEEDQEVKGSMKTAIDLYHRACTAKFAVACRSLGMVHWEGKGVKQNYFKAIEYFKIACDLGLPEACPDQDMMRVASGNKGGGGLDVGASVSVGQPAQPKTPDGPNAPNTPSAPEGEVPTP
jgi:TPR repeat protein